MAKKRLARPTRAQIDEQKLKAAFDEIARLTERYNELTVDRNKWRDQALAATERADNNEMRMKEAQRNLHETQNALAETRMAQHAAHGFIEALCLAAGKEPPAWSVPKRRVDFDAAVQTQMDRYVNGCRP